MKVNRKNSPGRGFIKVNSILMIIFGLAFSGILVNGLLDLFMDTDDKNLSFLMVGAGLTGIVQFIAGIIGVRNCGKLKKATTCLKWGIIAEISAVVGIILIIISTSMTEENFKDFWGLCVVPILPILYIIGAVRNRNTVPHENSD